jgi:hypothetical protein
MKTNNLKLFEKYYNGLMSPDEKAEFDKSLASDPELNASFREYLSIYEALSDQDTLDLRHKLKEIREENSKNRNTPDFFGQGYNWLWMAALLTIIISFTIIASMLIANIDKDNQKTAELLPQVSSPEFSLLDRELMRFEQRHSDFRLESPLEPIVYKDNGSIKFQWTISIADKLIIDIIDWNGTIVYSSGKPVSSPHMVKKKLPEGIMVFRFRTETNAYFLGFLFIK